jgi:hypothetical protein
MIEQILSSDIKCDFSEETSCTVYLECCLMKERIECASLNTPFLPLQNKHTSAHNSGGDLDQKGRPCEGFNRKLKHFLHKFRLSQHQPCVSAPAVDKAFPCTTYMHNADKSQAFRACQRTQLLGRVRAVRSHLFPT